MKFKAGDKIIIKEGTSQYERVVIGYSQKGYVVYEYKNLQSDWSISSGDEDKFKLAPVKKEGWINVYTQNNSTISGSGMIYTTKEEAIANKSTHNYVATVKVEWEQ